MLLASLSTIRTYDSCKRSFLHPICTTYWCVISALYIHTYGRSLLYAFYATKQGVIVVILENVCNFETTNARCVLIVLIGNSDDSEQPLFWKCSCYVPVYSTGPGRIFDLQLCPNGDHLGNGSNYGTINTRCMFLVLIESSDDVEQLVYRASFLYLITK